MTKELRIDTMVKLNNGVEMPLFGLGTYQATRRGMEEAFLNALEIGYRLIDTAQMYGNEREVGNAIRRSRIPREEIFVTTKLSNSNHGYERALRSFETSLEQLGLSYVDLFLIHWPAEGLRGESWRALEKLLEDGKCSAIGVSNYMIGHLNELRESSSTTPAVNQVEFSPYLYQKDLLEFCRSNAIQLEGYSPLTKGENLTDPALGAIASKYSKTSPQILLRWALQKEIVTIPKSTNKVRLKENADIFDFEISQKDMESLDSFNIDLRTSWDPTTAP
jgi:diketogulonate reductase-like aldo/keto reductase